MTEQKTPIEIERASLEPVVRRALSSTGAEVLEWRVEPLGHDTGSALGPGVVHRVAGVAADQGRHRVWSLVRKRLRPPAASETGFLSGTVPNHQFYWKREAHVYTSELLQNLPSGLAAPRCYGVDEDEDGIVLWLEDVAEPDGPRWSLERYGNAARHLGRFNGASIAGRPLPEAPWLCRDMVHWRQAVAAPFWDRIDERRDEPWVQRG